MKNIFKKNQIIITALAIMIVIAGYLSFTNRDAKKDDEALQASTGLNGLALLEDGMELATDTTGNDTTNDTTTGDTTTTDGTTTDDTTDGTLDAEDENATDESTPVETQDNNNELGDISDEDILAKAQDVTDNGELNLKDGTPGEAVLANALDAGFFITSKLEREQVRAQVKATYLDMIANPDISEEDKKQATQKMLDLLSAAEKERAAEMLLEAKGFDGAVVFINDGEADVVVNAATLTDQQLAIIEDVVKRKTDIDAKNITIMNGVVTE